MNNSLISKIISMQQTNIGQDSLPPLDALKALFIEIKTSFEKNLESQDCIVKFNNIVLVLSQATQEFQIQPDQTKFIFEELIPGLVKRALAVKTNNLKFALLISDSINNITDFFGKTLNPQSIFKERIPDVVDIMRTLFDSQQKFYQSHFLHDLGGDAGKTEVKNDLSHFSPEEKAWRSNLKVGEIVDALKYDGNFKISMWCRGGVEQVFKDSNNKVVSVVVRFINDIQVEPITVSIDSNKIAPLGTKAEPDEWRSQLKKGDLVDAMDRCNTWYLSTVIVTEERKDAKMPMIKVGFRQYANNGDKEDSMGKYFGFSEKLDEHIGSYTVRIQKPQTYCNKQGGVQTLQTEIKSQLTKNEDQDNTDLLMLETEGQIIFATERNSCKSTMFVNLINKFGKEEGFTKLLDFILQASTTIDSVFYIVDAIAKCQDILHKSFVDHFYERLRKAIEEKIFSANQQQLRLMKRERVEELVTTLWEKIMARLYSNFDSQVQKNILNLEIGVLLLKLNFMEKRIEGAKFIDNICKNSMLNQVQSTLQKSDITNQLIEKLREKQVFQEFFSRTRCHAQLVQRSQGLLKLLISQKSITEEELIMVWDGCKSDESIKIDLYKVIADISSSLGEEEAQFFIKKIVGQKITSIKVQELDLLEEIAKQSARRENGQENLNCVLQFFWHFIFDPEQHSNEKAIALKATIAFSDILKAVSKEVHFSYMEKIAQNLQSSNQGFLSIKILSRFIENFVEKAAAADQPSDSAYTKSSFIEQTEKKFQLLEQIFVDFKSYMKKVQDSVCTLTPYQIEQLGDQATFDRFSHADQLKERVQLIGNYAAAGNSCLQLQHLENLWNIMIKDNLIVVDHPILYKWLRTLCDAVLKAKVPLISQDSLIKFFTDKTNSQDTDFINLSLEGYYCFQTFFILMNRKAHRLILLGEEGKQVQKFTSYSNSSGAQFKSYSFSSAQPTESDPETQEVLVKAEPNQMEGILGLWKIAIDSLDKKVGECVTNLLLQLHTNLDFGMEDNVPLFEDQFIGSCLKIIAEQYQKIQQRTQEENKKIEDTIAAIEGFRSREKIQKYLPVEEKRIIRCLTYIQMLIQNSEKDGTYGLRPHSALNQGELLTIKISNSCKTGEGYRSMFEIYVQSNFTIYELKRLIGEQLSIKTNSDGTIIQETPIHPQNIKLSRYSTSTTIKDSFNGSTLSDLRFKQNEQLSITSKGLLSVSKVPLLNEDGVDINARAYFIFTELFNMYAIQDPDDESKKIMRIEEVCNFIKGATKETCHTSDSRATYIIGFDSNGDGKLEQEDFIAFYRKSCFEKVDVVRQNLVSYNYNHALKQVPKNGQDINILQPRKTFIQMPRYKLANDHSSFNVFFLLLNCHKEVQIESLQLIQMMCSNPTLFWNSLWLEQIPSNWGTFDWKKILDSTNLNKLLYTLELIDSFIQTDPDNIPRATEEYSLRLSYVLRFLQQGGFAQLAQLLGKVIDRENEMSDLRLNLLDQLLRIIKTFVAAAIQADQPVVAQENIKETTKAVDLAASNNKEQEFQQVEQNANANVQIPFLNQDPEFIGPMPPPGPKFDGTASTVTQDLLFGDKNTQTGTGGTQTTQPSKQEEQKNEVILAVNEFESTKRFQQIVSLIREQHLQEYIFSAIDFKVLQNDILGIVATLTLQVKYFRKEENAIVLSGLALWTQTILKNNSLIHDFYNLKVGEMTASDFIKNGIYSGKALAVRLAYKKAFEQLAEKIELKDGVKPLYFILDVLIKNFPEHSSYESAAYRDCNEYFLLLIELIGLIQKTPSNQNFDLSKLLVQSITRMKLHQSSEKPSSIFEDKVLVGYILLVRELLPVYIEQNSYEELIAFEQEHELLHEMFYENLYYVPGKTRNENQNKCKVINSRTIAYKLLYRYLKALKPKELVIFLENDLGPMVRELPTPTKWSHQPSDKTKYQYAGIVNLGCICYMISMLQQFYMVPQFRYQLLKAEINDAPNIQEWKGRKIDDNLLLQFQRLFGFLELSERQAYDPTDFIFSFKDFDGKPTNTAIQQDSQEFLNIFFDRIENMLKPTSQKNLLQDVFRGSNIQQLICQQCGRITSRIEHYYNLSVEVKNKQNLYQSLDRLLEPSEIQDYFCDGCQKKVDIQKRTLIGETPNVLFVHLQRIVFSFDTFANEKINTKLEFPQHLDLRPYTIKHVLQKEGTINDMQQEAEIKDLVNIEDDYYLYKLVGVNIHIGSADHGHYYSIINTNRGVAEVDPYVKEAEWLNVEKDNWRVFNDEEVKYFSFKDLAAEAFGGNETALNQNEVQNFLASTEASYGKSAYMLVYERKKKKDINEVQNDAEVSIKYRDVAKFVPDWISKQVQKDNIEFVVDRQVFHPQFFNLVKLVLAHIGSDLVLSQHLYDYTYYENFDKLKVIALEIGHRVMFDFLSRYSDKSSISQICDSMCSVVTFSESWVSFCTPRSSNLMIDFIKQHYLSDHCKNFFELMFVCGDQQARQYIAKFTARLINRAFSIYGVCSEGEDKEHPRLVELYSVLHEFMQLLMYKLHEKDCQTNWSRLMNYFTLLMEIGTGGKHQTLYMLQNYDYVVDICDVMLGNKSPKAAKETEKRISMGGSVSMTPFGPLVALACHLVRSTYTRQMIGVENLEVSTFTVFQDDRNPSEPKVKLQTKIQISDEAYQFFTNPDMIQFVMQNNYQEEEFGRALTHLCYDNPKLSKFVCQYLLRTIVTGDYERIKPYLQIVIQMIRIKDHQMPSLQRQRLEWIFGFGFLRWTQSEQKVKVGLENTFHNIKEEIYMMKSMLTYDPENDNSLLHLLWRYQGRMDTYTVNCLEDLAIIISGDDSVKQYFAELPGMTYQFARYSDWIKPYLETQLKNSLSSTVQSTYHTNIKETSTRVLDHYKVYEEYLKVIDGEQDHPAVISCNPTPFVILKQTDNETYLDTINEKDGVILTMSFVECQYVLSQPTGKTNLAIGPKFLEKYTPAFSKLSEGNKSAAAMLKERDQQVGDATGSDKVKIYEAEVSNKEEVISGPYYQIKTEDDSDDSFKDWDGNQISTCRDLIYKLTISNTTNTPICFKIKLSEKNQGFVNLRWPRAGVKGTLEVDETQVVAIFHKIEPSVPTFEGGISEIEKLDVKLDWKLNEKRMKQIASQQQSAMNSSALRTNGKAGNSGSVRFDENVKQADSANATDVQNTQSYPHGANGVQTSTTASGDDFSSYRPDYGGSDGGANAFGEKQCGACTSFNPITASVCDVCLTTFQN